MTRKWLWVAPALVAAAYGQTEGALAREGRYWVQTLTGTASLQGSARLRVSNRGAVRLQGEERGDIAYSLKKRARVSSESSARQALSRPGLKASQQGGWTTLATSFPAQNQNSVSADLTLRVPRKLLDVELDSEGGSVEAFDLEGTLKAETGGGKIHIDRVQGEVAIRTGGGEVQLGKIGKSVRCASGGGSITAESIGGEAGFSTGGGEIFVKEASGAVRASTAGGNIRVERAGGPVTAATGGGLIEVGQAGGQVAAESGGGSIKVRLAGGVRCEAGSGSIQLVSVFGSLRASTGAGSILAELVAGKPLEDSVLSTGSGDITVFIPSNLAVTIQAISDSPGLQRIISEFPELQARVFSRAGRAEAQGALNGGGPVLKLSASDGTIYLRRQKH